MKKIFVLFTILLAFSSCKIQEEVTINKNGSGEYRLGIDMGTMMETVKGMGQNKDSLSAQKVSEKKSKKVDSIIPIIEQIYLSKDSLKLTKKEEKALNEMKGLVLHLQIDEDEGKMRLEYIYPFKKIKQLDNFFQNIYIINQIDKRNKKNKEKKSPDDDIVDKLSNYKVEYKFKKKHFGRKTIIIEKEKRKDTKNNENKNDKFSQMFTYQMIYHFPYPIKKVKYTGEARMSTDRKTLYISIPMDDLEKNKDLLDFDIFFE
jgi:hypothetical protein